LKHDTIFSVLGNCDSPDFVEILEEKDVSVQRSLVFHDGLAFAGSGGATIFTGKTEFEREEDDILSDFDIVLNACNESGDKSLWNKVILISHNPPKNTICDAVNPELHVGSQKFADFILENQPLAVITGHVHEGKGVEKIGNTTVINPGALMEGNYAWLEVKKSGDSWTVVSASLESVE
jgi:Icc-related predicted phosphoesterase